MDKYKQKVQASQNAEKERESLRQELEEARSRVMATDKLRRENAQLRQEHDEMSQTLQRSEQEHNELRLMKKEAFAEMKRLNRDLKAMHEKSAQDQERMADLEDRFGGSETHSSPTVVDGGLESELAESSKHEQQMQVASNLLLWVRVIMSDRKTRILELEKRIRQLTDDASNGGTKVAILQRQLDNAQDLSADQCKQFQVFRQEISQLQTSILEVRQGHPIEGLVTPYPSIGELANYSKAPRHSEECESNSKQLKRNALSSKTSLQLPKTRLKQPIVTVGLPSKTIVCCPIYSLTSLKVPSSTSQKSK